MKKNPSPATTTPASPSRSTIKDIARLAECSPMTVSRVLRGLTGHNKTTVGRVKAAAKKLNYRPSMLARTLRTGKTYIVGCLVPEMAKHEFLSDLFFSQIMLATEAALSSHGMRILIVSVTAEQMEAGTLPDVIETGLIRSAICVGIDNENYLRSLNRNLARLVTADFLVRGLPGVTSANRAGGAIAAEALWNLGHRRFAILDSDEENRNYRQRREGFLSALEARSIVRQKVSVERGDVWQEGGGRDAVGRLMSGSQHPTALFCVNDHLALDALKELEAKGFRVPSDLSVCGYDDMILSAHARPTLSTIAVDKAAIGRRAAEFLLDDSLPHTDNTHLEIPVKWIARESTGKPPRSTT